MMLAFVVYVFKPGVRIRIPVIFYLPDPNLNPDYLFIRKKHIFPINVEIFRKIHITYIIFM